MTWPSRFLIIFLHFCGGFERLEYETERSDRCETERSDRYETERPGRCETERSGRCEKQALTPPFFYKSTTPFASCIGTARTRSALLSHDRCSNAVT